MFYCSIFKRTTMDENLLFDVLFLFLHHTCVQSSLALEILTLHHSLCFTFFVGSRNYVNHYNFIIIILSYLTS